MQAKSPLSRKYFGQYYTSENIHRELLSLINPVAYLLNKIFVALVSYAKNVFFLKKEAERIFCNVLEFMLTLAKIENNSTSMWKKGRNLRLEHFESYSSFSYIL